MLTEDQERFLACVDKTATCWLWTGPSSIEGYGRFTMNGRVVQAHRAAWQMFVADIPSGLVVMHLCDVSMCVSLAHLVVGTRAANNYDCQRKGRLVSRSLSGVFEGGTSPPRHVGEKHPCCVLRSVDVIEMRAAHGRGAKVVDLAKQFSVSTSTARLIVQGRSWRHLLPAVSS